MAYCAHCGSYVAHVSFVPCASCGKPTNGAPPAPVSAGGGTNPVVIVIAVAGAACVILIFIGMLAAIAIPNLLTAMERPKQKRTMAGIRTIATAVDSYINENNKLPEAATLEELRSLLVPKHASTLTAKDGWGNDLRYAPLPQGYALGSGGADGKLDQALDEYKVQQGTQDFDCDIVFAYGKFVQYPAGLEQ